MHKIFKTLEYQILELFFEDNNTYFAIREIARRLKKSHATIINHLHHLERLGLIAINKKTLYPTYAANPENKYFQWYKKNNIVLKIMESGIIEYLQQSTFSDCIILFGSCAKGYYTEKSDIDIFVESNRIQLSLGLYEKKLNKPINVLFEQDIRNLGPGLKNNIMNGIVLYGFLRLEKP